MLDPLMSAGQHPLAQTPSGGSVTVPDPSERTLQQSIAAVGALREIVETRLSGMDKAILLLQTWRDHVPLLIAEAVAHLSGLQEEKFQSVEAQNSIRFDGISIQFAERDKRTEQLSLADKTAIAAALQAQKEAAGATNDSNSVALTKMENNFTKLIDQIVTLISSNQKTTDDKITDIKDRQNSVEGRHEGRSSGRSDVVGWIFGAAGTAAAVIMMVLALLGQH